MAKPRRAVRRAPWTVLTALAALCMGVSFAGCSSPPDEGTLDGTLEAVGGPAGTGPQPLSGSVTFHGSNGNIASIGLSANGRFSAHLPVGRYTVAGRSPGSRGYRRVSGTRTGHRDQPRHEPRRDRLPGKLGCRTDRPGDGGEPVLSHQPGFQPSSLSGGGSGSQRTHRVTDS